MSNATDTAPAARVLWLLTFAWGVDPLDPPSPNTRKYASWNEPTTVINTEAFAGEPSIEVDLGNQQGGSRDVVATVQMALVEPLSQAAFYPIAPVRVTIERMTVDQPSTRRVMFTGWVGTVVTNHLGKSNLAKFTVHGIKSMLGTDDADVPLGVQCNSGCWHRFGDALCRYPIDTRAGIKQTGALTIVQGSTVRVAGLTPFADLKGAGLEQDNKLFFRGTLIGPDGTAVDIRDYTGDGLGGVSDETLVLEEPPPPEWSTETVTVVAGCDKTPTTCAKYDNVERLLALGWAMPDHHPQFEEG